MFQPLGKRVLVRVNEDQDQNGDFKTSKGGIIMVEDNPDAEENYYTTTAVAVGPDVKAVEVGNVIYVSKLMQILAYKGNGYEDADYYIINEGECMGMEIEGENLFNVDRLTDAELEETIDD